MKRALFFCRTAFSLARKFLTLSLSLAVWLPTQTAHASGVVTNCNEAALRAALAGGGRVAMACDGTIVLTNTIIITADTVLDASGHSVSLSGNNAVRIIQIASGISLTLSNLTLKLGRSTDGGAAIANWGGILRASDCVFATQHQRLCRRRHLQERIGGAQQLLVHRQSGRLSRRRDWLQ